MKGGMPSNNILIMTAYILIVMMIAFIKKMNRKSFSFIKFYVCSCINSKFITAGLTGCLLHDLLITFFFNYSCGVSLHGRRTEWQVLNCTDDNLGNVEPVFTCQAMPESAI